MLKTHMRKQHRRESGQSIVIIAIIFIGLIAFIGLTVDLGILLINLGHLRRAVDAASIAAATQYREGWSSDDLNKSATEFLRLNGVDLDNLSATVQICNLAAPDPELCTNPPRKLVRVTATADVQFSFLPVIGFNFTTITATAIGEAASMDVILVIDISESMTDDGNTPQERDPASCNATNTCQPFRDVKAAAANFATWVLNKTPDQEEDRLAVVIFSNGWEQATTNPSNPNDLSWPGIYRGTHVMGSGWMNDQADALTIINNLRVYESPECEDMVGLPGPCRQYNNATVPPTFEGIFCPYASVVPGMEDIFPDGDASTCTTTNIGGGLRTAGMLFSSQPRLEALWVVVLLTDGAANATMLDETDHIVSGDVDSIKANLPLGYCPSPTNHIIPFCRDQQVLTRHPLSQHSLYDADDYARDQADLLGCDPANPASGCPGPGQGIVMFSIGLGQAVQYRSLGDNIPYGDALMRYVAAAGDDGDPSTDPCNGVPYPVLSAARDDSYTCGNYYFAEFPALLDRIFDDIASRIFTRIAH